MKKSFAPLLAAIVLAMSGCESAHSPLSVVREKFSPTFTPHVVPVEKREAYEAARRTLDKMGYKFTSGGPAQGKLEAISSVRPGDGGLVRARQISVQLRFSVAIGGGTEVSTLFTEIVDDTFSNREGMGTTQAIHDSPLYEVFFQNLDQQVAAQTAAPSAAK